MAVDVAVPRSRRAILAGTLGALGGAIAGALGRPSRADAVNGGAVTLGVQASIPLDGAGPNQATAGTSIYTTTGVGFSARTDAATNGIVGNAAYAGGGTTYGVYGISAASSGRGLNGHATHASGSTIGVAGEASSPNGIGVRGHAPTATGSTVGVQGLVSSTSGTGVAGTANAGTGQTVGVFGQSASSSGRGVSGYASAASGNGSGVFGQANAPFGFGVEGWAAAASGVCVGVDGGSASGDGIGVRGHSSADSVGVFGFTRSLGGPLPEVPTNPIGVYALARQTTGAGVVGLNDASGAGVVGLSGASSTLPAFREKTGVYGEANQDSGAFGVFGKSTVGQGVRGEATSGTGVRAVSATGKALDVTGKFVLNRSGIAQIPANATFVDVAVPGGIAATSMVLATLQLARSGVYVRAARPAWPVAGKLRIDLNKAASTTASTPVAWMVLG